MITAYTLDMMAVIMIIIVEILFELDPRGLLRHPTYFRSILEHASERWMETLNA